MQDQSENSAIEQLQPQQTSPQEGYYNAQDSNLNSSNNATNLLNNSINTGQLEVTSSKEHKPAELSIAGNPGFINNLWLVILIIPVVIAIVVFRPKKKNVEEIVPEEAPVHSAPAVNTRHKRSKKTRSQRRGAKR
jgi:hypothetical protein